MSENVRAEGSGTPAVERVVVGVDASEASKEALRWAARYATFVGARLEVVHAWHPAEEYAWVQSLPPPAEPTEVAGKALAELVHEVIEPGPTLDVSTTIVRGHAVKVLTQSAKGASLLVLGDRGFGGFDGMLLGSISEKCAAHAPCSIVIVRRDDAD